MAYNYLFVKSTFEARGYTLVSTEYKDSRTKLDAICPSGHPVSIIFNSFHNRGYGCRQCGYKVMADKTRIPYSDIVKMFEDRNCKLLTSEEDYKTTRIKVDYICSCGKPHRMAPDTFRKGHDCGECKKRKQAITNIEKYGVANPMSNQKVREKALQTLYKNGTAPTSLQQKTLHDVLGGVLNYPVRDIQLDIAFLDKMMYIEYDGSGHNLDVKLGLMTEEEFAKKERNRRYLLMRRGWKEIRIKSMRDKLPCKEGIKDMYNYANRYLEEHSWITFDIDKGTVLGSELNAPYAYKKLKRIRTDVKS